MEGGVGDWAVPCGESTGVLTGSRHGAGMVAWPMSPSFPAAGSALPIAAGASCRCLSGHTEGQSPTETREHSPDQGQGDTEMSPVPAAATCHPCTCFWWPVRAGARTILPAFPFSQDSAAASGAALPFTGLDPLRSRAERGRRVPIPLRKHKTIKEEQWSFLPVTPNTKRHQNVAQLRAALPGLLLCPLTRGRNCRHLLLFLVLARDAAGGRVPRSIAKGLP